MTHNVHIEVMIDANAHSRDNHVLFQKFRDRNHTEAAMVEEVAAFGDYLREAQTVSGGAIRVSQRDTAQIFHEKTNLFTPELADKGGYKIRPSFIRNNLRRQHADGSETGFYNVEQPVHGEAAYYDALEDFLRAILPQKAPEDLQKLKRVKGEERLLVLQELYIDHMQSLPSQFRRGKYAEAFREYRKVRFNAGEETAVNFIRERELPPQGERRAFVFVGNDKQANKHMRTAREGKEAKDAGRMEVYAVRPSQLQQLLKEVIEQIEADSPHKDKLQQLRMDNPVLQRIMQPPSLRAASGTDYTSRVLYKSATSAPPKSTSFVRPGTTEESETSVDARKFADFVTGKPKSGWQKE